MVLSLNWRFLDFAMMSLVMLEVATRSCESTVDMMAARIAANMMPHANESPGTNRDLDSSRKMYSLSKSSPGTMPCWRK